MDLRITAGFQEELNHVQKFSEDIAQHPDALLLYLVRSASCYLKLNLVLYHLEVCIWLQSLEIKSTD